MQLSYNTQEAGEKSIPVRLWGYVRERKDIVLRCAEFFLIAAIFFGLGMVYAWDIAAQKTPVSVTEPPMGNIETLAAHAPPKQAPKTAVSSEYEASKNGTKYYPKGCPNRIKDANKVYFATKEDAEKAGYTLAKNCSSSQ